MCQIRFAVKMASHSAAQAGPELLDSSYLPTPAYRVLGTAATFEGAPAQIHTSDVT